MPRNDSWLEAPICVTPPFPPWYLCQQSLSPVRCRCESTSETTRTPSKMYRLFPAHPSPPRPQNEVDEARLRREIPPPILERLQRELLNSSLPSGPGFTAPNADTCSSSSSSYGSRRRHGTATGIGGTVARRLGATGPALSSNGHQKMASSPGSYSSSAASGDVGSGGGGGGPARTENGRGMRRGRPGGGGGGGAGGERCTVAGGECWRDGDTGSGERGRGRGCGDNVLGGSDDDGLGPGLLSSPPKRTARPIPRSRRWAEVRAC